jgi:hypothetical protein
MNSDLTLASVKPSGVRAFNFLPPNGQTAQGAALKESRQSRMRKTLEKTKPRGDRAISLQEVSHHARDQVLSSVFPNNLGPRGRFLMPIHPIQRG